MPSLTDLVLLPVPRIRVACPGTCPNRVIHDAGTHDLPAQGYRLELGPRGISVAARDADGRRYADATLAQLRLAANGPLPCGTIEDWPDFPRRGVMLDISRTRVPTMATLRRLVDELAAWKFNHLELYTEHTFAYRNHAEVWKDAGPMTAEQVRDLDAHCRKRGIELVPNQNCFGHLARWLKHDRYRDLAETPDGHTAWGQWRAYPFSLNPLDPRSLALVEGWMDELLPNFESRRFNVGCDETVDLGQGRSKEECERRGKGRVYLEFLLKIHEAVRRRGHTMHFWGDIILHHPELIPELPRDVVAMVWGYEAGHPFEKECAAFQASGIPFWVCPGTSTWNSLTGRTANMLGNLRNAAEQGLRHGAAGLLVTDWGDNGHWQPWPFLYPGLARAAAVAWCGASNDETQLQRQLAVQVLREPSGAMAGALLELGNAYLRLGKQRENATQLFWLLFGEDLAELAKPVTRSELAAVMADVARLRTRLEPARARRDDAELLRRELALGCRLLEEAAFRAQPELRNHREGLAGLVVEMAAVWQARHRPEGLDESLRPLRKRLPG